jgi:hypothetical protein
MSRWYRAYEDMACDPKFFGVAARSGETLERVVFVWLRILGSAAKLMAGGAYKLDPVETAAILRCKPIGIESGRGAEAGPAIAARELDCSLSLIHRATDQDLPEDLGARRLDQLARLHPGFARALRDHFGRLAEAAEAALPPLAELTGEKAEGDGKVLRDLTRVVAAHGASAADLRKLRPELYEDRDLIDAIIRIIDAAAARAAPTKG